MKKLKELVGKFRNNKEKTIIDRDIDSAREGRRERDALNYAVSIRDFESVKLMLTSSTDEVKGQALVRAAAFGFYEIVEILLKNGVDANSRISKGKYTALMYASYRRDSIEIVKLLIEYGADVNLKDYRGQTALIWAIMNESAESIKTLLMNNASVDLLYDRKKLL